MKKIVYWLIMGFVILAIILQIGCEKSSPPQVMRPTPRPRETPVEPTPSPVPPSPIPTAPAYAYDVRGRRDPFVSLITGEKHPLTTNPQLSGVEVLSLTLTGIVVDRSGPLALVKTADGKPLTLREGDQLVDARLVTIGEEALVFERQIFGEVHRLILKLSKGES